jgi:hypothetical protein
MKITSSVILFNRLLYGCNITYDKFKWMILQEANKKRKKKKRIRMKSMDSCDMNRVCCVGCR